MTISHIARAITVNQPNWRIMSRRLTFGTRMPREVPILKMRAFSVTSLLCQHIGRIRKPAAI
jgi:hypothetical protein